MDFTEAIERNRAALAALLAAVAALVGGRDGGGMIARGLRNAALALLRPAEAAARRLIVVVAQGLVVAPRPPRPFPGAGVLRPAHDNAAAQRVPAFPLFDRWKRFRPMLWRARPLGTPRIRTFWGEPQVMAPVRALPPPAACSAADPDAPVDATLLRLRLRSLERALADLPRQARRLARWRSRAAAAPDVPMRSPLRPGRPPGYRRTPGGDADVLLRDCHALACEALRPDTS